jgi:hypothetical protein
MFSTTIKEDGSQIDYWHEGAYYQFDLAEVEILEGVSEELHTMCIEAAKYMATGAMGDLGIGSEAEIESSGEDWLTAAYLRDTADRCTAAKAKTSSPTPTVWTSSSPATTAPKAGATRPGTAARL